MKVLECHLCNSLFRSSEDHITVFKDGKGHNYCTRCSVFVFTFGIEGLSEVLDVIKNDVDKDNGH